MGASVLRNLFMFALVSLTFMAGYFTNDMLSHSRFKVEWNVHIVSKLPQVDDNYGEYMVFVQGWKKPVKYKFHPDPDFDPGMTIQWMAYEELGKYKSVLSDRTGWVVERDDYGRPVLTFLDFSEVKKGAQ